VGGFVRGGGGGGGGTRRRRRSVEWIFCVSLIDRLCLSYTSKSIRLTRCCIANRLDAVVEIRVCRSDSRIENDIESGKVAFALNDR
jgi:hypothetical protein